MLPIRLNLMFTLCSLNGSRQCLRSWPTPCDPRQPTFRTDWVLTRGRLPEPWLRGRAHLRDSRVGELLRRSDMRCSGGYGGRVGAARLTRGSVLNTRVRPAEWRSGDRRCGGEKVGFAAWRRAHRARAAYQAPRQILWVRMRDRNSNRADSGGSLCYEGGHLRVTQIGGRLAFSLSLCDLRRPWFLTNALTNIAI
jgi:hypothetical protein